MSALFDPVAAHQDRLHEAYVEQRRRGVAAVFELLSRRLPGTAAATSMEAFARLTREDQERLLMHPLVHEWWYRLSSSYKAGDVAAITRVLPELDRLLAAQSEDVHAPHGVARVPGTSIEVGAEHPWAVELLERQNELDPAPGYDTGDLEPLAVDEVDLAHLAAALDLLAQSWPDMRAEITDYVRLIVPFRSAQKYAFTNTVWQGAIFLAEPFSDPVLTTERLVHECSHLRLNLIMAHERLHEHDWAATVRSPFRKGLRPVTGLYHGAFVFTRVAVAMSRLADSTGDERYAARIPDVAGKVRESLTTLLGGDVRLTPVGRELLMHIDRTLDEVAAPVADAVAVATTT